MGMENLEKSWNLIELQISRPGEIMEIFKNVKVMETLLKIKT